jgi:ubiquitin-protein ligase
MEASVRLQNELKNFQKNRPYGFYAKPDPKNILFWKCQFYHNGFFYSLSLTFSKDYPIRPPGIVFDQKMFHPNIFSNNTVCLDIITSRWSPSFTIKDILIGLKQLLDFPNPRSPANPEAGNLFTRDKKNMQKRWLKLVKSFSLVNLHI